MTKKYNVAVVGATGTVGEAMLHVLAERKFPVNQLYPLASERSSGLTVKFGEKDLNVLDVAQFDFSQVEIGLFSAGSTVSAQYAPLAAKTGCVVIDNTAQFRYDPDVPLVIPEVNAQKIEDYSLRNIIANPNCSTIQMLVALKPIYDAVGIKRINIATYQAVSGSGRAGVDELSKQTTELLHGREAECQTYPRQIAFNVIPHIDRFMDNGYTFEEMKMVWETQKILEDDAILVNPTAVRVPVFYGHSEAIHIETAKKITEKQAKTLLAKAPGVELLKIDADYPTPISHGNQQTPVFVGRVRKDISHPNGLDLWVVADNVLKGAALNAVQIAEILLKEYL